MNRLRQIHAYTLRNGIDNTKLLIVDLLEIPNISYAHRLLDHTPSPTLFLFNKVIQAYSSLRQPLPCLRLYSRMCLRGCPPNQHSFTFLFAASASLSSPLPGMMLHTHFLRSGFDFDVFALTALIDMYAKLGELGSARQVFDETPMRDTPIWNSIVSGYARRGYMVEALELFRTMPCKNVISWTSIISGCSQNGHSADALKMFLEMEEGGFRPNEVTVASVLPACANLGALEIGERIETYARGNGFLKNMYVCNALLEMYAKCGKIDAARRVFDEIGSRRGLCSWNTMIAGLASHGKCNEVLELYDQMLSEGTIPDDITFVGLLLACTHGGLVAEGRRLFKSMGSDYGISPKLEHYGCMVDLLGRAGKLQEARDLIRSMPMKPDSVIWGALLGACSFHGDVEFAEEAAESLIELEPWNPGNYVVLSNIYASVGRWDGVSKLRKMMKGENITKAAGYSIIQEGGEIHKFIVEDKSHVKSSEIYAMLRGISAAMKIRRQATVFECELVGF
ncbi:hypothetical protein NL676_010750 [Syzygium grande]|nr:hypothetical protein NL676_010750 [Syzygium grande]